MNNKILSRPEIIASITGALLLVLGSIMKWLLIPTVTLLNLITKTKKDLEYLMESKSRLAAFVGFVALAFTLYGFSKKRKGFMIAGVVFSAFILVLLLTAYLPKNNTNVQILNLDGMATGYYVSFLGFLLILGGSIATLMKSDTKKKTE